MGKYMYIYLWEVRIGIGGYKESNRVIGSGNREGVLLYWNLANVQKQGVCDALSHPWS